MKPISLLEELKKIGLGILFVCFIIFVIAYFKFNTIEKIGFLIFVNLCFMLYFKFFKNKPFSFLELIKNAFIISGVVILLKWVGYFGKIGYSLSILIIVALIIIRKWEKYLEVKWYIEAMLFGKPIKDYVKDGKKPPKLKIKF